MYAEKNNHVTLGTYSTEPGAGEFCLACQHTSMLQLGCRRRSISLISLIILAISNMLLIFFLLQSENCIELPTVGKKPDKTSLTSEIVGSPEVGGKSGDQTGRYQEENDIRRLCPTIVTLESPRSEETMKFDVRLGRWDSRRLFRTFDGVLVGADFAEVSRISKACLATQSSLEKLHSLVQVAHQWTGPISVALYAAGDDEFEGIQRYLDYLRRCYQPIRERVIFSLAVPKNRPIKKSRDHVEKKKPDCGKPEATLAAIVSRLPTEQTSWRSRNVYPQNHLRNLARKNCQNEWVFLTDVDIVPSDNMTLRIEEFLNRPVNECEKCAYVVPTYEIDARVKFPTNKIELVNLARKGLARPFHQKVFMHNQFATNFTKWISDVNPDSNGYENVKSGKIYISHDVTNFELFYEPFYIAKDTAPQHDERFMGYGYTRNTQVYEMFVAGYQFKVLSPIFTGHWGLQTRKGRPAWRERQNSSNRKHFDSFKREIFARYQKEPPKLKKGTN